MIFFLSVPLTTTARRSNRSMKQGRGEQRQTQTTTQHRTKLNKTNEKTCQTGINRGLIVGMMKEKKKRPEIGGKRRLLCI